MTKQLQKALDKAEEWARSAGLSFCPIKTVAVVFTRRAKIGTPPLLRLGGRFIEYTATAKYLGILLDSKLTFGAHIKSKLAKARRLLMACTRLLGKTFSPRPKSMKWMYTAVVRSMFTYGAFVWGQACAKNWSNDLRKLQRLALKLLSLIHI